MTDATPTVRLRPKIDARRLRRGFPWVYANQMVTDRRTRALKAGTISRLEDADRNPIGIVAVNPNSKIIARILDHDPDAQIDQGWFLSRLRRALRNREAIYDAPYYRLIHAEADGLPGVIIDRFGSAAVVQPNAVWADDRLELLVKALAEMTGITTIVKNAQGRGRALEGLDDVSVVSLGHVDAPVKVPMNGATYMADLLGGQKTGLYYDQRPNHEFVASLARGTAVLDVFSHVGGFALATLAGGADRALSIDASEAALNLAVAGAKASEVADRYETRVSDAFPALVALHEEGRNFGTVICDPPAFAPNAKALNSGLRAYEKVARLSALLVEKNGTLTLCSCSHAADLERFRSACVRGIGRAGRRCQIIRTGFAGPDHPQ
ncbi:MAG: RSP_2647 family RNA methyltransferase, partial [Boseongicola sp.]